VACYVGSGAARHSRAFLAVAISSPAGGSAPAPP
jgi:hypothetical protein